MLGCGRSEPLRPATAPTSAGNKQIPFHAELQPVSATPVDVATGLPDQKSSGGVPFWSASQARVLPAGTLLTVQLKRSLATAKVHAGDEFSAAMAAPRVVDGAVLIDRGTELTGRVEAARSGRGSGYVELTLSSMMLGGTPLALQTSSLFARGRSKRQNASSQVEPSNKSVGGVRVAKGQRLTFRLTAPLTLDVGHAPEKPQSASNAIQ